MTSLVPRILVVEDDEVGRSILAEVLGMAGYSVLEAEGYQAALREMQREPAHIALLDLRLPDGNGLDLMRELRANYPDIILLITTGFGSMQTAVDAINEGAYAYIVKPYEPQALLNTLRQASDKWRLERRNKELMRQTRAEADRVTALLQASEEISMAYMDITAMTRRIVQTAVRIMAARTGFIGLLEGETIRVHEWWGGMEWHPSDWSIQEGEGSPGFVWQTRTAYRSDSVADDPRLLPEIRRTLNSRTMISCPILTRYNEFLGVLDLSDKNGGEPFTDDDVRFLEGLCRHVAVALENARLYEEQRRSDERRKQFYREVVSAATRNKLILCDEWEMNCPTQDPALAMRVEDPQDISTIRYAVEEIIRATDMDDERMDGCLLCLGEAATNAFKHGGGGEVMVWLDDDRLLIRVEDQGPGIDETLLPKATLLPGYSTKASLGMGLTIILDFADQLRLSTGTGGTRLDMEISVHPKPIDPLEGFQLLYAELD